MKDKIIELLSKYGALSFNSLVRFLGLPEEEVSKEISKIENINILKIGKNYELIDNENLFSGLVYFKNGRRYIKTETDSYMISDDDPLVYYEGDRYIFKLYEDYRDKKFASLMKFISHDNRLLVAIASKPKQDGTRMFKLVNSDSVFVSFKVYHAASVATGDLCYIRPLYRREGNIELAEFDSLISKNNELGNDVIALVAQANVPFKFPDEVNKELERIPLSVSDSELKNRIDHTNDLVITIDGDDSKDFDDAVSLKILDNGNYLLGVHIADVSNYVKENSEIDKEALKRGTSIYLVDRVIPMLDFKLSNGICSLNEGVIRLTLSSMIEFDCDGNVVNSHIESSYIKSCHRMTYRKCNLMLDEKNLELINEYRDIYPMLLNMRELSSKIRAKRNALGSIDFDIDETKVIVNELGEAVDVVIRERGTSELMIEDFMLSANQAVASSLFNLDYPCLYRVHEEPSYEKIKEMKPMLESLGLRIRNVGAGIKSKDIQNVLEKIKDSPSSKAISQLILRSMAKARYDASCLGHFGLAMKYYCHFTSPIRRYPDLMVHRIINDLIINPNDFKNRLIELEGVVDDIAFKTSYAERRAIDLEREVNDMKEAEYMSKFIGKYFDGIISSITSFGMFIMLDNGIEGLAHITSFPEYLSYDKEHMCLVGNYTDEVYNIGDKVKVRLISSDKSNHQIDFIVTKHTERRGNK